MIGLYPCVWRVKTKIDRYLRYLTFLVLFAHEIQELLHLSDHNLLVERKIPRATHAEPVVVELVAQDVKSIRCQGCRKGVVDMKVRSKAMAKDSPFTHGLRGSGKIHDKVRVAIRPLRGKMACRAVAKNPGN